MAGRWRHAPGRSLALSGSTRFLLLVGGFTLFTGTLVAVGAILPTAKEAGQIFGIIVDLFLLGAVVLQIAVRFFRYRSIAYTSRVSLRTAVQRK